ncbi:MAG TPA: DUF1360 domain-containing protein [Thermoleophilaceae bacterium]|jgi:hypothetical protein
MAGEPTSMLGAHARNGGDVHGSPPTDASDYAVINLVYGALFTGVILATRERARKDPVQLHELIPMSAATFALAKVIAKEKVGTWVREPFVEHVEGEAKPEGRGLRRAVGELVTCTRCVGAWSALGVVGLRLAYPDAGRNVTNVLAVSGANDWLQAGFKAVCARSD